MITANTSFEHVIHNIQERDRILHETNQMATTLLSYFDHQSDNIAISHHALSTIHNRIHSLYNHYNLTIERFNIGIISFVSDYYSIIDEHTDQFHSKFLHTYSSHRGHYNPILSEVDDNKFDITELVDIFEEHCFKFTYFKVHTNASHLRRARERTWIIYQKLANFIASERVYDSSDLLMYEFETITTSFSHFIKTSNKQPKGALSGDNFSNCVELINKLKHSIQKFNNIKLDFKPSEEILDYCECGHLMQVMAGSSEMVCNHCGYLYELKGTVFDDNQFYSQEGTRYKHAGYEPSKHCKAWLERIQARETNTITDLQLMKIDICIRRDGITNKKRLTIEQLRRYLKDTDLTELNEHVALIKRLITGITPPQLTYAETQAITNSFSKAVKAYNIIRPRNKSNMLFYPFLLWKLIDMHVTDYSKRKSLLSFIHLQGTQTLIQNDQIWHQICGVTPGFHYRPTDRYEYLD
jgi:hypothetical protein